MPSAVLVTALVAAHAAPALSAHVGVIGDRLGIVRRPSGAGTVALTFDDGPHPKATPRTLELLAAHGVHATFFLVGEQVRRHPELAREIVAAGHAVGLHGDRHRNELGLGPRALVAEHRRGLDAIATVTGVWCSVRRPPYGAVSGAGLVLARRAGLRTVLWSRWGRDWRPGARAQSVAHDVLGAGLGDREIILLHDADHYGASGCWQAMVGALPRILEACGAAGLRAVTIGHAGDPRSHG